MVGSKMSYNAKVGELQSPESAFFALCKFFFCFQPNSWTKTEGIALKSFFLCPVLTFSTKEKLLNECLQQFWCLGPGIEHNSERNWHFPYISVYFCNYLLKIRLSRKSIWDPPTWGYISQYITRNLLGTTEANLLTSGRWWFCHHCMVQKWVIR